MFRRRPLRPLRRIFRPTLVHPPHPSEPPALEALRRAQQLKESGQYPAAAEIFEKLARGAEQHGILQRAPFLYLQVADCRLRAGEARSAAFFTQKGLQLLAKTGRWAAFHQIAARGQRDLTEANEPRLAADLSAWVAEISAGHEASPPAASPASQPERRLPAKCPQCGATVRADLLEWIGPADAECPYCGSVIQAE